jgi:hypothetical protein
MEYCAIGRAYYVKGAVGSVRVFLRIDFFGVLMVAVELSVADVAGVAGFGAPEFFFDGGSSGSIGGSILGN